MWLEPTAAHCSTTGRTRSNAPSIRPAANSTASSINPSAEPQITHESLGRDLLLMFVGLLVLDPRASFQVGKFKMAPGCKTDARKPTIAYIRTHLARNRNNGNTGRSSLPDITPRRDWRV